MSFFVFFWPDTGPVSDSSAPLRDVYPVPKKDRGHVPPVVASIKLEFAPVGHVIDVGSLSMSQGD